ncbi:Hsp70 protein-domain-containing protein [Pelagophyceae sp. CCMP2097]|nr:Hsp70 protein-domain-containing protein [Pelagophyceae sp. CCMP2097]|eukprot:CAMPEP_0206840234 /NCGR_PEP_ID=MMETSP0975-20121206/21834_1 /ASSEMBLY_ACC=CAM_ASM_000399 /TAXON_ID=483370 /ORGANISM="non described non described, Strain CCMP2097" /LENGTH=561 /DNA_ID=CAMNT_0054382713 /DNA_START=26 /DNA_END=1711 /DNA_ORIENTATION=-
MAPVSYCAGIGLGHREARVCVVRQQDAADAQLVASESGSRSLPVTLAYSAGGEWVVGDAANAQAAKNAKATIFDVLALLPRDDDDDEGHALRARLVSSGQKTLSVEISEGGQALIVLEPSMDGEPTKITAEEALAKVLAQLKVVAEDYVGAKSEDRTVLGCVVACDVQDETQRLALMRACKLARLEVLQLVSDAVAVAVAACGDFSVAGAAATLQSRKTQQRIGSVVVLDIGATSARAAKLHRDGDGVFRVACAARDDSISGVALTKMLEDHCTTFILRKQKITVSDGGFKAIAKLRAVCERSARLLAAGSPQVDVEAEALVDGVDCRVRVTKALFDDRCSDIFRKIAPLVQSVVGDSKPEDGAVLLTFAGGATAAAGIRRDAKAVLEALGLEVCDGYEAVEAVPVPAGKAASRRERAAEEAATFGAAQQAALLVFGLDPENEEPASVNKAKKKLVCERADAANLLAQLPFTTTAVWCAWGGDKVLLVAKDSALPRTVTATFDIAEAKQLTFSCDERPLARVDVSAASVDVTLTIDKTASLKVTVTAAETEPISFDCPAAL